MKYTVGMHVTRQWRRDTLEATIVEYNAKTDKYTLRFHNTNTDHEWSEGSLNKTFTIVSQPHLPDELFTL